MFASKSFSNVGRKTAQSIDTLKKRLGVDVATVPDKYDSTGTFPSSASDGSLRKGQ